MRTEDGQSVAGRIQNLLGDIKKDITDCGLVINKYHQHSTAGSSPFSLMLSAEFDRVPCSQVFPVGSV